MSGDRNDRMDSILKENWLKGMEGLKILTDTISPSLEDHYEQTANELNDNDTHLQHLLDLAAKQYLMKKQKPKFWDVNCLECKPILAKIVESHKQPWNLMWKNIDDKCLGVPVGHRLAKIYMPGGNKESQSFSDCDPLAILEVCRNDKRFIRGYDSLNYLILFRNRCVHSCDNCIKDEELTDAFDEMKKLLGHEKFKQRAECIDAIDELDKLRKKPILRVYKSNEIWKAAISLQRMALAKVGECCPEDLKSLIEKTRVELKRKIDEKDSIQSRLKSAERALNTVAEQLKRSKNNEIDEKRRADLIRVDLQTELEKHETDKQNLQAEIENLQKELVEHNASLIGRVAKGSGTGGVVGLAGGPIGAATGAAAGAVVGGISYFWDMVSK